MNVAGARGFEIERNRFSKAEGLNHAHFCPCAEAAARSGDRHAQFPNRAAERGLGRHAESYV
jgi:hypothetical protein